MAPGERQVVDGGRLKYVNLSALPPVPACTVRVRTEQRVESVTLQPQNVRLDEWRYANGYVTARVPSFLVHQMVVFQ